MEKLVYFTGDIALVDNLGIEECMAIQEPLKKLHKYEIAEEQGFPTRDVFESIGDTVYYIYDYEIVECINCGVSMDCEGKICIALACDEDIFPYRNPIAEIDMDPTDWCKNSTEVTVDEWEKTVFLTKESAEQKLASMQKGETE